MEIAVVFDVLMKNRSDIVQIVDKLGGLGNLLSLAPEIMDILNTISSHPGKDPAAAIAAAKSVLYYNNETAEKVKKFQKEHGLDADGIVGDQTWSAVEKLIHGK